MSRSIDRTALMLRYLAGGSFNALFGVGAIFLLMHFGVPPLAANVAGYAVGLAVSFVTHRLFVFRARGPMRQELPRFVVAFLAAFAANLLVLEVLLRWTTIEPYAAQFVAIATYVVAMFALCDALVFRDRRTRGRG